MHRMRDSKGTEIALNQIVKHENIKKDEVNYYYVGTGNLNYLWLFRYDKNGKIEDNSLDNIKIDTGVDLVNNDLSKWTVMGTKEEIYDKIFNS